MITSPEIRQELDRQWSKLQEKLRSTSPGITQEVLDLLCVDWIRTKINEAEYKVSPSRTQTCEGTMNETQAERIARNVVGEYHYLCRHEPRKAIIQYLKNNTDLFCPVLSDAHPLSDEELREMVLIEFGRYLGAEHHPAKP